MASLLSPFHPLQAPGANGQCCQIVPHILANLATLAAAHLLGNLPKFGNTGHGNMHALELIFLTRVRERTLTHGLVLVSLSVTTL